MRSRLRALGLLAALAAAAVLLLRLSFVALGERPRRPGEVIVGSKAFTESIILAEVAAETLEKGGIPVDRRFNLGGTQLCFDALRTGKIDLYPEYTGTALLAILHGHPEGDRARARAQVRHALDRDYQLAWLEPLGFENTYALAMPRALAERLGIARISDLASHPELRAGFASEFLAREDGWPGLAARYGLHPRSEPASMEAGLMYRAAASGQVDLISAYSTDGRVSSADLVLLDDDRAFFPPYEAAFVARRAILSPAVAERLSRLAGTITARAMRQMNFDVDSGKRTPEEVARELVR